MLPAFDWWSDCLSSEFCFVTLSQTSRYRKLSNTNTESLLMGCDTQSARWSQTPSYRKPSNSNIEYIFNGQWYTVPDIDCRGNSYCLKDTNIALMSMLLCNIYRNAQSSEKKTFARQLGPDHLISMEEGCAKIKHHSSGFP